VKVDVSVYSWNDVDRKVKEMVAAGDAPDLAQIGAYADYAAEGDLYSRPTNCSPSRRRPTSSSQLADAGKVKHNQYGMPFAASTRVLFYNKKLFTEAGLTPPTTWSELAADAEALKEAGVKYPYALPLGLRGGAGRDHAVAAQRRRRLHQTSSGRTASTPPQNVSDLHLAARQPRRQGPDRARRPGQAQPRGRVRRLRRR
jgi:ABC-type glycerol-3-phosphate transport system substrate-binding protein